jgi:hypothetical protein
MDHLRKNTRTKEAARAKYIDGTSRTASVVRYLATV